MDLVIFSDYGPSNGETIFGNSFETFQGGKGANQAVAASRLDADVTFVGKVGKDFFGKRLKENLLEEDINVQYLGEHDGESGVAFINVFEETSENQIIVVPGANSFVESSQVTDELLNSTDILISQFEVPPSQTEDLFKRAKSFGNFRILNTAPVTNFSRTLLSETDLSVVNEIELESLSGKKVNKENPDTVRLAVKSLPLNNRQSIVVTLGSHGAYIYKDKREEFVAGLDVDSIDSTGSGDCFIGALATSYLENEDLFESVKFANSAAAISTTKRGTSSSMPTKDQVVNFLQSA